MGGLEGWMVTYCGGESFQIRAVGKHLLEDVVGAIEIGTYLGGASPREIARALEGFTPPMQGRSSVHRSDITIIDDSYNASLDSTRSILSYISNLSWNGEKKVVLGPMKELGAQSRFAHRSVANLLANSSFGRAYLYGNEMKEAASNLDVLVMQTKSHLLKISRNWNIVSRDRVIGGETCSCSRHLALLVWND